MCTHVCSSVIVVPCGGISIAPPIFASQLGWCQALQILRNCTPANLQTSEPASQQARVQLGLPPSKPSRLSTMATAVLARRRSSMATTLMVPRSPSAATAVCVGNSWRERRSPSSTVGVRAGERWTATALVQNFRIVGQ